MRKGKGKVDEAADKMAEAARLAVYPDARPHEALMARCLAKEADDLMTINPETLKIESGEVAEFSDTHSMYPLTEAPDQAAVDSSIQRTEMIGRLDCISLGIDTANSVKANSTPERMLAHQMAACHKMAFDLMTEAADLDNKYNLDRNTHSVVQARKLNAANRLMQTFQSAMLTLSKVRAGGKQTMIVQHVNVNDGGQAIVAGGDAGGRGGGNK